MKTLYFDCSSGISGDMTLGALLDLGIDKEAFVKELEKLNVDGYDIVFDKSLSSNIPSDSNFNAASVLLKPYIVTLKSDSFGVTVAFDEIFNVAEKAANPIVKATVVSANATITNILLFCFFIFSPFDY